MSYGTGNESAREAVVTQEPDYFLRLARLQVFTIFHFFLLHSGVFWEIINSITQTTSPRNST